MVFLSSLVTSVLLASTALAAPSKNGRLANRLARRGQISRGSKPLSRVSRPTTATGNVSHVDYSSNWAGAVYESDAGTYTAVTASFVVPTPQVPSGGDSSTTYSSSAWVGIDGDTCGNAILQTGVDFTVQGSSVSYDAWYEWYPDYAYDFDGFSISAGDTITTTVTASSTTAGTAVIENVSTGQVVTQDLTSSSALCEQNAEWIVEDFEENGGMVPFADFGTVTFTGAQATTGSGTVGPDGATIIDISQNNQVLTSVSTDSSSVTVQYQ